MKNFEMAEMPETSSAVAVEQSRAIQEVQGAIVMAKKFPRNETACFQRVIEACKRKSLAESAMYTYPRGKEKVSGASIKLAETLAKNWGNIQYGIVELSQDNGASEVLAYAWDLETNTRQVKQFSVKHSRYTKSSGITKLTDPRDIYEMTANQGARRLRACILGILPSDLLETAIEECEKTLKGDNTIPLVDRVQSCIAKFSEIGVNKTMIEKRLNHSIHSIDVHELVGLGKIYNSIRDNMSKIEDYFDKPKIETPETSIEDSEALNQAQQQLFNKK
jgi:hypothetical protein